MLTSKRNHRTWPMGSQLLYLFVDSAQVKNVDLLWPFHQFYHTGCKCGHAFNMTTTYLHGLRSYIQWYMLTITLTAHARALLTGIIGVSGLILSLQDVIALGQVSYSVSMGQLTKMTAWAGLSISELIGAKCRLRAWGPAAFSSEVGSSGLVSRPRPSVFPKMQWGGFKAGPW